MAAPKNPLGEDLYHLKGRIGEAFVETLLRRANYFVARVGRESHMPSVMKTGPDAYMPDFLAWREERVAGTHGERPLYNIVAIEVKYRSTPEEFLREDALKILSAAHKDWPNFCIVLVTDHPDSERSCFQVLRRGASGLLESVDLPDAGFDVFPRNATLFSGLLKEVFHALGEAASAGARQLKGV